MNNSLSLIRSIHLEMDSHADFLSIYNAQMTPPSSFYCTLAQLRNEEITLNLYILVDTMKEFMF